MQEIRFLFGCPHETGNFVLTRVCELSVLNFNLSCIVDILAAAPWMSGPD
jgi:hypothetical protein